MKCPDDGTCHHDCVEHCFRVQTCGPLSGVYPGDRWPIAVLEANGVPMGRCASFTVPELQMLYLGLVRAPEACPGWAESDTYQRLKAEVADALGESVLTVGQP